MQPKVPAVLILTAGRGSRLGDYSAHLNKALLPLGKRAIISRIIDRFPEDTRFVIAVGHRSEQVRTYLKMAHPNLNLICVDVDNFDGPGSGPGYSTLCCKDQLQEPFFYVSCDTLWEQEAELPTAYDWLGSARVPSDESAVYCNLELGLENEVVALHDKTRVDGEQYRAFIGLAFIKDYESFWRSLGSDALIGGERQISNGFKALVLNRSARAHELTWLDTGDAKKYREATATYENYDFSKPDEALYISKDRVIKFFANPIFAETRVARARSNSAVFPPVSDAECGFYNYPFINGRSLYEHCSDEVFVKLLTWLPHNLWKPLDVDPAIFSRACHAFYREKTEERLRKYFMKYPEGAALCSVNGTKLQPVPELLASIPWDMVCQGNPSFFHGDFHFDHILFDQTEQRFTLLDWRQDFGGHTTFGDTYYDLAKFCGGLRLNYDYIKQGRFNYSARDNQAELSFDRRKEGDAYERRFHSFIEEQGYNLHHVKLLVPIIFLNMAPLHHYPFDQFLFALGCLTLQAELGSSFARTLAADKSSESLNTSAKSRIIAG